MVDVSPTVLRLSTGYEATPSRNTAASVAASVAPFNNERKKLITSFPPTTGETTGETTEETLLSEDGGHTTVAATSSSVVEPATPTSTMDPAALPEPVTPTSTMDPAALSEPATPTSTMDPAALPEPATPTSTMDPAGSSEAVMTTSVIPVTITPVSTTRSYSAASTGVIGSPCSSAHFQRTKPLAVRELAILKCVRYYVTNIPEVYIYIYGQVPIFYILVYSYHLVRCHCLITKVSLSDY